MSKTIVFKSKFEKKLKKLRIKTIFVENFKKRENWRLLPDNNKEAVEELNNCRTFAGFFQSAFSWRKTPQAYKYWDDIFTKHLYN